MFLNHTTKLSAPRYNTRNLSISDKYKVSQAHATRTLAVSLLTRLAVLRKLATEVSEVVYNRQLFTI